MRGGLGYEVGEGCVVEEVLARGGHYSCGDLISVTPVPYLHPALKGPRAAIRVSGAHSRVLHNVTTQPHHRNSTVGPHAPPPPPSLSSLLQVLPPSSSSSCILPLPLPPPPRLLYDWAP
ncbi:hypothetical protein Pmani_028295 [Petrolisthes manimaculis]|uniref:Uncharacterized protein n=1 Tax=Petrolisthes manimaculis TaxID=1843537 RepID=A0AAE1TY47_9EUCA|nr:hypothetical protein Pmani_028295 [Petrolisthes manimaculis]